MVGQGSRATVGRALTAILGCVLLAGCSPVAVDSSSLNTPAAVFTPTPEQSESGAVDRYEGADFALTEALPENLAYLQAASIAEFA